MGSAILVAFAISSLSWRTGFARPRTPFDLSAASSVASGYALLRDAAAVIPLGSSVVARVEPPNPIQESYFHRFAVSLLPGRRVRPAALYEEFTDDAVWKDAEFLILVGGKPAQAPGERLLETPQGSVWRRPR